MGQIFTNINTICTEGEKDRPAVVAAWQNRIKNMPLANIAFPSNGLPKTGGQSAYTASVNEVLSTNWYIDLSRIALGLEGLKEAITFADIGCRTPADASQILEAMPDSSKVFFCDKDERALDNIDDSAVKNVSVNKIASPASVLPLDSNSINKLRGVRLMQQTPVNEMTKIANEAFRVLETGGQALFLDLAWRKATTEDETLNRLQNRFSFELGNPVINPNADLYTPEVLRRAGFEDVRTEYVSVQSSIKEKFLLWSGVTRIAFELHEKGLLSKKDLENTVKAVDEAYDSGMGTYYTMPIAFTIGTVPS